MVSPYPAPGALPVPVATARYAASALVSGGRGIRTHGVGLPTQLFSRQPPSATRRALLRGTTLRERGASRDVRPGSARVREAVGDAGDRAAAGGEVLFETVEVDG